MSLSRSLIESAASVLSEAPSYTVIDNSNTKVNSFEKFLKVLEDKLNLDLSIAIKREKDNLESIFDAFKNRNYKLTAAYYGSKNYNELQKIGYKTYLIDLIDKKGKGIDLLYTKEEEEEDGAFFFSKDDYHKVSNVKNLLDLLSEEGFDFGYLTELLKKDFFMYFKMGYLFAISKNKKEEKYIKSEGYELSNRYNQARNPLKIWIKEE